MHIFRRGAVFALGLLIFYLVFTFLSPQTERGRGSFYEHVLDGSHTLLFFHDNEEEIVSDWDDDSSRMMELITILHREGDFNVNLSVVSAAHPRSSEYRNLFRVENAPAVVIINKRGYLIFHGGRDTDFNYIRYILTRIR